MYFSSQRFLPRNARGSGKAHVENLPAHQLGDRKETITKRLSPAVVDTTSGGLARKLAAYSYARPTVKDFD